jgi:hypothetical protein
VPLITLRPHSGCCRGDSFITHATGDLRCFGGLEPRLCSWAAAGGGRMWIPRDLAAAKKVERYFELQNPTLDRYWTGEPRRCSCPGRIHGLVAAAPPPAASGRCARRNPAASLRPLSPWLPLAARRHQAGHLEQQVQVRAPGPHKVGMAAMLICREPPPSVRAII